jgi:cytochrome P450
MVLEESMRLYPPAWILGRRALSDDRLGDHVIPAGSVVAISPYLMHRHPGHWEDPDRFDPERFTKERSVGRKPFAYFPFGGGPRLCIGHNFAMLEAQLIIATVAQRFTSRLLPGHEVAPERLFVLRPRGGLPMVLQALGPAPMSPN